MASSLNVESLLTAAFLKAELEFLRGQSRFQEALAETKTTADFARLRELGQQLLAEYGKANRSAQQMRESSNPRTNAG